MRTLLLFLTGLIALASSAQTLTQAQRQEALQCATKFCELLTRFSNGERTLNTQINALCSGADCSAFDDIKTNKEITLRNYLLAIQTKYPQTLPMTITPPSLSDSKTYFEPILSLSTGYESITGNVFATANVTSLSVAGFNNAYVVFNVIQKYPTLNRTYNKRLIYDVNNKKITAFIKTQGTFLHFINGMSAMSNKDYKQALSDFDAAAFNNRSSLGKKCYYASLVCCIYSLDFEKALYYAQKLNEPLIYEYIKLLICIQYDQIYQAHPHVEKIESLMEVSDGVLDDERGNMYVYLGCIYATPQYPHHDLRKARNYFEKAANLGILNADFFIYVYWIFFGENFVPLETAYSSLKKAAMGGFPPAYYPYGMVKEIAEDYSEAQKWYEKSARSGNYIAMACYGKLLLKRSDTANGISWLKKSLTCPNLDEKIELEGFGFNTWPKSRADVQALLNKYDSSATSSYSSSSSYSPSSSYSSSASTSSSTSSSSGNSYSTTSSYTPSSSYQSSSSSSSGSYSGYSSYSSYSSHKFNEAKDDFCMGLSAGYVRKEWVYNDGSSKEKLDVFWEDEYTNGIQVGLRVDCQFGYGFGLNSGLFYEYYFDKSEDFVDNGITFYYRMKEHSLYLPVHFKYNLNFSRWFQIGLYGGIGLDCGLSGKYILCSPEELYSGDEKFSPGDTLDSFSMYSDEYDLKRFNASLEYGAAIRIRRLQLNFTIAKGLVNMSGSDDYTVKQNKVMSLTASLCF